MIFRHLPAGRHQSLTPQIPPVPVLAERCCVSIRLAPIFAADILSRTRPCKNSFETRNSRFSVTLTDSPSNLARDPVFAVTSPRSFAWHRRYLAGGFWGAGLSRRYR